VAPNPTVVVVLPKPPFSDSTAMLNAPGTGWLTRSIIALRRVSSADSPGLKPVTCQW
jgi:hypothetical protein